jgi:hypothetical protein
MAESVQALPNNIQQIIEVHEWDLRTREGIQRFKQLRAKSLPSVALNEELVFEAIIPPQEELIQAIRERYERLAVSP